MTIHSSECPGCPGRQSPGCEHPMCIAMIRYGERQRKNALAEGPKPAQEDTAIRSLITQGSGGEEKS